MQASATLQKTTWQIDPDHSKMEFSILHMLISQITGHFKSLQGKVITEGDDFSGSYAEIILDASSIDTNNPSRDLHLVSQEFLDAPRFPQISFQSTSVKKIKDNIYRVDGTLTLHGISRPLDLQVGYNGKITDPNGNTRAGFRISGKINRKDFGINWSAHLDEGGLVAGDVIDIYGNMELITK
jgi:polyisoprenoid-binding protein YceI